MASIAYIRCRIRNLAYAYAVIGLRYICFGSNHLPRRFTLLSIVVPVGGSFSPLTCHLNVRRTPHFRRLGHRPSVTNAFICRSSYRRTDVPIYVTMNTAVSAIGITRRTFHRSTRYGNEPRQRPNTHSPRCINKNYTSLLLFEQPLRPSRASRTITVTLLRIGSRASTTLTPQARATRRGGPVFFYLCQLNI